MQTFLRSEKPFDGSGGTRRPLIVSDNEIGSPSQHSIENGPDIACHFRWTSNGHGQGDGGSRGKEYPPFRLRKSRLNGQRSKDDLTRLRETILRQRMVKASQEATNEGPTASAGLKSSPQLHQNDDGDELRQCPVWVAPDDSEFLAIPKRTTEWSEEPIFRVRRSADRGIPPSRSVSEAVLNRPNGAPRRATSVQAINSSPSDQPLTRRPSKPELVSPHSWRKGLELIRREFGPRPRKPKPQPAQSSCEGSLTADSSVRESFENGVSDNGSASHSKDDKEEKGKADSNIVRPRQHRRSPPLSPSSPPPQRTRHYDPSAVRSFLRRQRLARRAAMTAEAEAKAERERRRSEQLAALRERQRANATPSPPQLPCRVARSPTEAPIPSLGQLEEKKGKETAKEKGKEEEEEEEKVKVKVKVKEKEVRSGVIDSCKSEVPPELRTRIQALENSAEALQHRVRSLAEALKDPHPSPPLIQATPTGRFARPSARSGSIEDAFEALFGDSQIFFSPRIMCQPSESALHHVTVFPLVSSSMSSSASSLVIDELCSTSTPPKAPPRQQASPEEPKEATEDGQISAADTEHDIESSLTSNASEGPKKENETVERLSGKNEAKDLSLRSREKALKERRRRAEEVLKWRSRLDAEEAEICELERRAREMRQIKVAVGPGIQSGRSQPAKWPKRNQPAVPAPRVRNSAVQPNQASPPSSSAHTGPVSPPSCQSDSGSALTSRLRQCLAEGRLLGNKPQAPRSTKGKTEGASEEDESLSISVSETDLSDIEGRVRLLSEELRRRQRMADRLKREQKRARRERLKQKEEVLQKHIEMYDKYITDLQTELATASGPNSNSSESLDSPPVRPVIKSPRAATQTASRPPPLRVQCDCPAASLDFRATLDAEDNEDHEDDATLTPSPSEEAAPWLTKEAAGAVDGGGPLWRRDSGESEAAAESNIWSAPSSGPPSPESPRLTAESPRTTKDDSAGRECASWVMDQLIGEVLSDVESPQKPSQESRVAKAVADWLNEELRATIDVALVLRKRLIPQRRPVAEFSREGRPSYLLGGPLLLTAPKRLIPHTPEAVQSLVAEAVAEFSPALQRGDSGKAFCRDAVPIDAGLDVRAQEAHRRLTFDLSRDCAVTFCQERRAKKRPANQAEILAAVSDAVAVTFGFLPEQRRESRLARWTAARKKDRVEDLLLAELRREERGWTDYAHDEARVKLQTADVILEALIMETAELCKRL